MLSFKRSCETISERHKFARYLCVEEKGRYLFAEELKLCCRCCGCPTFPCRFPWPVGWPDFAGLPAANLLFTIFDALRARTPIRRPMIDFWWCFIVPRPPRDQLISSCGFLGFFAEFPNCNGFWPVLILRLWNFVLSSCVGFVVRGEVDCVWPNQSKCVWWWRRNCNYR